MAWAGLQAGATVGLLVWFAKARNEPAKPPQIAPKCWHRADYDKRQRWRKALIVVVPVGLAVFLGILWVFGWHNDFLEYFEGELS